MRRLLPPHYVIHVKKGGGARLELSSLRAAAFDERYVKRGSSW